MNTEVPNRTSWPEPDNHNHPSGRLATYTKEYSLKHLGIIFVGLLLASLLVFAAVRYSLSERTKKSFQVNSSAANQKRLKRKEHLVEEAAMLADARLLTQLLVIKSLDKPTSFQDLGCMAQFYNKPVQGKNSIFTPYFKVYIRYSFEDSLGNTILTRKNFYFDEHLQFIEFIQLSKYGKS